jgi:4-hydroxyphenylpyruvate dioxygenase
MVTRLALHTWSLDTTSLAEVLRVIKRTGWDAVELRRLDFRRATEAGGRPENVLDLVRAASVPVAAVGVEFGWMFAEGDEHDRLLAVFAESCRWAQALGCATVMSPVDKTRGDLGRAADRVREVADRALEHGLRLALEFNSQAEQFNTLERCREVVRRAAHPGCGLLVDTYHLGRSGGDARAIAALDPSEIAYVQYSDVPASGLVPGMTLDRVPPGRGTVDFPSVWAALAAKNYGGYVSYEAPNASAWARSADEVAHEALTATRTSQELLEQRT